MIRAFMLALGIFLLILGAQSMVVDRWMISKSGGPVKQTVSNYYNNGQNPFSQASFGNNPAGVNNGQIGAPLAKRHRVFRTREWMPWSLLAAGAIVVLYSVSLRPRE